MNPSDCPYRPVFVSAYRHCTNKGTDPCANAIALKLSVSSLPVKSQLGQGDWGFIGVNLT